MTATHREPWLGAPATGSPVELRVVIFFPWDPQRGKFAGERIHLDRTRLPGG